MTYNAKRDSICSERTYIMDKKLRKVFCEVCGKSFNKWLNDIKKTKHNYCSKKCYSMSSSCKSNLGKKGKLSAGWKGGCIYERGYRLVLAPNHPFAIKKGGGLKYIREHRLVMEKHLGRYLRKDEIVHHINEDISDNRLENLFLTDQVKHSIAHCKSRTRNSSGEFETKNGRLHPNKTI